MDVVRSFYRHTHFFPHNPTSFFSWSLAMRKNRRLLLAVAAWMAAIDELFKLEEPKTNVGTIIGVLTDVREDMVQFFPVVDPSSSARDRIESFLEARQLGDPIRKMHIDLGTLLNWLNGVNPRDDLQLRGCKWFWQQLGLIRGEASALRATLLE